MKLSVYLIDKIRNFIIYQNLIYYNQLILIAISGGQDSACLLLIILQLKKQFELQIGLIYCNHLWKTANLSQLIHILKFSYILSQPLYFSTYFTKVFNETKSRNRRYKVLARVAEFYSYSTILTGHTKTDYLETVLLNLFRGSSSEGMVSLSIKRHCQNTTIQNLFLNHKSLYEISNYK